MVMDDELTLSDVWEKMMKKYGRIDYSRKMVISAQKNTDEHCGALFLSIKGSPPKGYGIYVIFNKRLVLVDKDFSRKDVYPDIYIPELVALENKPDEYIFDPKTKKLEPYE